MNETELERLLIRLIGDGSSYRAMLNEAQAATQRFASEARSILGAVGLSFTLLGTAIEGVRLAAQFESMQTDMEVLLGSADAAKKMIADLESFSEHTPLRMPGLLSNAKQLMQMGIEAEQVVPILQALGNASGGSQEKLSQMTYVFGRMASMGRVTMREVRMLTTAGFNPLKEISKMTGESVTSLTEKLHKGGITAEMVVRAFNNASKEGGTFAGRLERQSQTLGGLFSTMRDHVEKAIREIGDIIVEGLDLKQVIRNVTEGARMVLAWLKALTPESRALIGQVLSIAAAVGAGTLAFMLLGPVIGTAVATMSSLIGVVVSATTAVIVFVTTGLSLLAGVLLSFATMPAGILVILALIPAIVLAVVNLGDITQWFATQGQASLDAVAQGWTNLKNFAVPAIKGIKDAIAARDLQLAFEIAWGKMKLTAFETIGEIKNAWADMQDFLSHAQDKGGEDVQKTWLDLKNWFQRKGLEFQAALWGDEGAQEFETRRLDIMEDYARQLNGINHTAHVLEGQHLNAVNQRAEDLKGSLAGLKKEQEDLLKKAHDAAANVPPLKIPTIPEIDPNKYKPPPQKMHVTPVMHWEPALADSAEAVARIQTQADMLAGQGLGLGAHATGQGRGPEGMAPGGGLIAQPAEALAGGNIAPVPVQVTAGGAFGDDSTGQHIVALLTQAVQDLDILAKKPQVNLHPANLAP